MNRDLNNNTEVLEQVVPAVYAVDETPATGADVSDCDSVLVAVTIGAIVGTNDDSSIILHESATLGGAYTVVAAADISETLPTALEPATHHQFGYIGALGFLKVILDVGTETSVAGSAVIIKGNLARAPFGYSVASVL